MVVAIRLADDAADGALDGGARRRRRRRWPPAAESGPPPSEAAPRTTGAALRRASGPTPWCWSRCPAPSALVEAMDALDAGHDVMVFSDNVPARAGGRPQADRHRARPAGDGARLRHRGGRRRRARLRQRHRPGPVGIVAASGTGCQQLLCLLDHAGVGVGSALGVGGRDLSAEVGGLSTREALRRLDADAVGRADRGGLQAAGRRTWPPSSRSTPPGSAPRSSSRCSGRGRPT